MSPPSDECVPEEAVPVVSPATPEDPMFAPGDGLKQAARANSTTTPPQRYADRHMPTAYHGDTASRSSGAVDFKKAAA